MAVKVGDKIKVKKKMPGTPKKNPRNVKTIIEMFKEKERKQKLPNKTNLVQKSAVKVSPKNEEEVLKVSQKCPENLIGKPPNLTISKITRKVSTTSSKPKSKKQFSNGKKKQQNHSKKRQGY